ncbi:MAG: hypothetical protein AB7S26_03065 [Sandaracinaceae bacterium]
MRLYPRAFLCLFALSLSACVADVTGEEEPLLLQSTARADADEVDTASLDDDAVAEALAAEDAEISAVGGGPPSCGDMITVNCDHSAFDGCREECLEYRENVCWYGYYCVPKPWYRSQSYCDEWIPIIDRSFARLLACIERH